MSKTERRNKLYELMGNLPERRRPIQVKKVQETEQDGYILEKLMLDLNGMENVPAYFVRPKDVKGKLPVVLYNHAHGGNYILGKDELLEGRSALQKPAYAKVLADMGIAALCIDSWAFGERRGRTESEMFKQMLWHGQVMWGMMVFDSIRAIDYLASRPDVDPERIATLGLSMGSTMAWWVAALDERIKVCVDICCLTDFHAIIDSRGLDGHGIYYYVPNLLNHFTTAQINALIAPRAHLSIAGIYDPLTPPAGLDRIDEELKAVYRSEGAADQWMLLRYDTGHFETADMRLEVLDYLKRKL